MREVDQLIEKLGLEEDEVLKALLTAFVPIQPGVLRQNWSRSETFGRSAPDTRTIWRKFKDADFRCLQCGSQRRLTLDHVDGDSTDHSPANLRVLCSDCNRGRSRKATSDCDHQLRIFRALLRLFLEHGEFPSNADILRESRVKQLGGAAYLVAFFKERLIAADATALVEEADTEAAAALQGGD